MKINKVQPPWDKRVYKRSYEAFYHTSRWREIRKAFMLGHTKLDDGRVVPNTLCLSCYKQGKVVPANTIDHIKRIKSGGDAYDLNNLQSLCRLCHDRKSSKEGLEKKMELNSKKSRKMQRAVLKSRF